MKTLPTRCAQNALASIAALACVVVLDASGAERFDFVVPGDDATPGMTDFSSLNAKPAGAEGFVQARNGHFFTGSQRLKIWGVNTCFGANSPTHDEAEKVAAHLAKLGVNGVRMHHHDTAASPRGVWGPVRNGKRTLDPEMLDRQDYFLDQLHRQGIYANLNLHVGRTFTEAEGFATKDLPYAVRYSKYLLYFEPEMRERFKDFCREYLTHTNRYRGLRRVDDPGIAMLEISNENSFSKVGADLAETLPDPYHSGFKRQWNRWLQNRYDSAEAWKKAWGEKPAGLPPGQSIETGDVDIPTRKWGEAARKDVHEFMVETEKQFVSEIMDFLNLDLGVRVPVTASQITYHSPEIVAETCDYADVHAYWQHPRFPGRPWDPANWRIRNTPMEWAPDADAILNRASWRLLDRPFTISEWNIPDPNDYAASAVPFAAMVAALQDWDGVFFFQYHSSDNGWFGDRIRSYFSFNGQPVKLVLFSAFANLYRRGDLRPLEKVAAGTLDQLVPATLGLQYRLGIDPETAASAKVAPPKGKRLSAPEERVMWDASEQNRAHVVVNTPKSRAVWGLVGGQHHNLGGIEVAFGEIERNYAAIVFTSLDGKPLEDSGRILLAAVGSAENKGMIWNNERTSVGTHWGEGPTQVNGIPMEITLPFRISRIHPLDGRGEHQGSVPLRVEGSVTRFKVGPQYRTLWYELVPK